MGARSKEQTCSNVKKRDITENTSKMVYFHVLTYLGAHSQMSWEIVCFLLQQVSHTSSGKVPVQKECFRQDAKPK